MINTHRTQADGPAAKPKRCASGRIYFSRDAERRFFFILTIAMAAFGLMVRFGWM